MFLDAIVRLYDYQREVNNHVLKVAEQLSTEELTAVIVEGQPSIRDTLLHSFDVIQINAAWWSRRLSGEEAFALEFPSEIYTNISELRVLWESGDSEVTSFIASLDSDADLGHIYKRKTPEGEMRTRVL